MNWRTCSIFGTWAVLVAGLLFSPGVAVAGPAVRAGAGWSTQSSHSAAPQRVAPSFARAVPVRVNLSLPGMTANQPAKEPVYANLRGPDGQTRRFLVEGGRAAIRYTNVVVRPGQSVTIRWVPAK